jgi:signal transduction histidine kinase
MAVLAYTVRAAIRRGARPINDLAASIDAIRDNDLTVRIDEGAAPGELVPVVARLNGLLERLEQSFKREKSFTSDAAHELRTPLAGLRSTVEVAMGRKREVEEYRETLNRVLGIVGHLEGLVVKLLILARLEFGQERLARAPVALEDKVTGVWARHDAQAGVRRIEAFFDMSGAGSVLADPDFLESILDEVFGNAVTYSDEGGSISVRAAGGGETTALSIGNTGSKVPSEDACRVFDRFWRGSLARSEVGSRFGLGLPIARMMTEAMGGRLEVETESGGEFKVTLTFPAADRDGVLEI